MHPFRRFTKWNHLVVALLLLSILLGACGPTPTPTPLPTSSPIPATETVPPTNTPVPPTETPIPPTETPIPPTPTPIPPSPTPTEDVAQSAELLQLAASQAQDGKLEDALTTCTELLDTTQDPELLKSGYYLRGAIYTDLGQKDLAIADWIKAIDLGLEDPMVFNAVCWEYSLAGQPEKGLPLCEKAVALDPSIGNLDSRGLAYALVGETDKAIADFQAVVDGLAEATDPESVAIRTQRSLWLEALKAGQNPFTPEEMAVIRGEVTPTPIAPTDTPVPPTNTPVPPTNTPVPQAAAPKPTAKPAAPKVGKIVFTSNRVSYDDLFIMNDDGTNIKQLTKKGKCYDAHFTPDGKTIFYENGDDIWKMSAAGGGQVNLSNSPDKIEAFPVVAPDGSRVAYLFAWPGGFEIYTMKLDGTDAKPVTSQDIDWMPNWSPDSKKIAFSSLRSGSFNIWIVNRDGSGLKQVTKFGGERIAITPVFSPDGKQIAFSTLAEGTAWEIWVVNVDGSKPHKVQGAVGKDKNNSANIAAWKQGKFLIGGWEGNWEPYFVPESGGAPVKIISGNKDDKPSDWWLP
jgi:WD40-like Beta Propeller Repeat/Tetratricopeptide repeat